MIVLLFTFWNNLENDSSILHGITNTQFRVWFHIILNCRCCGFFSRLRFLVPLLLSIVFLDPPCLFTTITVTIVPAFTCTIRRQFSLPLFPHSCALYSSHFFAPTTIPDGRHCKTVRNAPTCASIISGHHQHEGIESFSEAKMLMRLAKNVRKQKGKGKLMRQTVKNFILIFLIFHSILPPRFCFNFPLRLFSFVDVCAKIGEHWFQNHILLNCILSKHQLVSWFGPLTMEKCQEPCNFWSVSLISLRLEATIVWSLSLYSSLLFRMPNHSWWREVVWRINSSVLLALRN